LPILRAPFRRLLRRVLRRFFCPPRLTIRGAPEVVIRDLQVVVLGDVLSSRRLHGHSEDRDAWARRAARLPHRKIRATGITAASIAAVERGMLTAVNRTTSR